MDSSRMKRDCARIAESRIKKKSLKNNREKKFLRIYVLSLSYLGEPESRPWPPPTGTVPARWGSGRLWAWGGTRRRQGRPAKSTGEPSQDTQHQFCRTQNRLSNMGKKEKQEWNGILFDIGKWSVTEKKDVLSNAILYIHKGSTRSKKPVLETKLSKRVHASSLLEQPVGWSVRREALHPGRKCFPICATRYSSQRCGVCTSGCRNLNLSPSPWVPYLTGSKSIILFLSLF